jgi:hypothetical protein
MTKPRREVADTSWPISSKSTRSSFLVVLLFVSDVRGFLASFARSDLGHPLMAGVRHTRHHELCNLFRIPTGRACRKALALLILIVVSAGGECRASLAHQLTVPVCRQGAVSDRCTNLLASSSRIRPAKSLANATAISSSCKDPKWYSPRAGGKRISSRHAQLFMMLICASAAFSPSASFLASSLAQKCMK